jgi:small multidrug resistance family-3 protein
LRAFAIYAAAALAEIAGCFAFWAWVQRGAEPWVVVLGIASLVGFALALTRVDSAFAGRAYAAYGGIYIAASLMWLWAVEGQSPTRADLVGAALAIAGAIVIIGFAARSR